MNLKRKATAILLTLFMTLTPLFSAFAADSGQTEIVVKPTFGQTDARSMLDMINAFRTGDEAFYWNESNTAKVSSKGEPLAYSYALEEIAMQRAAEVALSFSHTRPDNTRCFTAKTADGVKSWGENIAAGSSSASGAFKQWREDNENYAGQGHRRNMLNPDYSAVGVGHVTLNGTHYWVQEFAYETDSAPQTTALDTERATTVTVSAARVANVASVTVTPESVTVQAGERVAVPTAGASVQLSEAWPGRQTAVDVTPAWTSDNASVCTVDGQEVVGVAAGSATLSAMVLGKSVTVPVTVSGGSGGGGSSGGDDPAPADGVYAILYDDGTFVFQNGNTPESGKNVTKTYEVDLNAVYHYDALAPWYNERESVRVVNFADKISPISTARWFFWCQNLERLDNIQNLDTANVTDMSAMFYYCSGLTALDVSHFDTKNVTDMSLMFYGCSGLTALDVSHFDTKNVTAMNAMFNGCKKLTALDVSRFDTAKARYMHYMFNECMGLTALDVSHFDTKNVTAMNAMFRGCSGLTALDVSHFDTANVMYMSSMFDGCSGLTALDVSHFDTKNVTAMDGMFCGCRGLTALDVSHFDTKNVTSMNAMFWYCSNLRTICASDKFTTASVEESEYTGSENMFSDCASLVGGNGTKYDSSHTDKEYARIDTASAPGYFTDINAPAPVAYAITAATPDNGSLSVTLTNPAAATLAIAYFDTDGRFLSVDLRDVGASAGSVEVALLSDAKTARVMMLDDAFRPLCAAVTAKVG